MTRRLIKYAAVAIALGWVHILAAVMAWDDDARHVKAIGLLAFAWFFFALFLCVAWSDL